MDIDTISQQFAVCLFSYGSFDTSRRAQERDTGDGSAHEDTHGSSVRVNVSGMTCEPFSDDLTSFSFCLCPQ